LVGAIFTDSNYAEARRFVLRTLGPQLEKTLLKQHEPDFKSVLQRLVQAEGKMPPTYEIVRRSGPEHKPEFRAAVLIEGEQEGMGSGKSKKAAEQKAAEAALDRLFPLWRDSEEGGTE
jgi:ribonuclease-3